MNEWIGLWMVGWINGHGWIGGWIYGWMGGWVHGLMGQLAHRWING